MRAAQLGLFGHETPRAWVDYVPGWLSGHKALFDELGWAICW